MTDRGLEALEFARAAQQIGALMRERGLAVPAFRSPPREPGLTRSIRRYPGGATVAITIRGRTRDECLRDMATGAVVAALHTTDDDLVEALLAEVDPDAPPRPSPPDEGDEEPF